LSVLVNKNPKSVQAHKKHTKAQKKYILAPQAN
jgi:hypothetical protein